MYVHMYVCIYLFIFIILFYHLSGTSTCMYILYIMHRGMYHFVSGRDGQYKPIPELVIYDADTDEFIVGGEAFKIE